MASARGATRIQAARPSEVRLKRRSEDHVNIEDQNYRAAAGLAGTEPLKPAEAAELLLQLRALVGTRVRYQGMDCMICDVVDVPPLLVLQRHASDIQIQPDSYGHPRSVGTGLLDVPVMDETGVLSAEMRLILLSDTRE